MSLANELAELFRRDLTRLIQELEAIQAEDVLWKTVPGITNSIGNLSLHLEGNLREYVGRILGGRPYQRRRDQEFAGRDVSVADLRARFEEVRALVTEVIGGLPPERLEAVYPENVLSRELKTSQFLLHLYGHFSYHLGQIDYLRRLITGEPALKLAGL